MVLCNLVPAEQGAVNSLKVFRGHSAPNLRARYCAAGLTDRAK